MAQVYSVNAVGYVNCTVQRGFNMFGNQLVSSNNTIAYLLPTAPQYTEVYLYTSGPGGGFSRITKDPDLGTSDGWDPEGGGSRTIDYGGGAFINNQSAAAFQLTFVGEVGQGSLANPIPAGFSIRSSKVPQSGAITAVLGFPPVQYDDVYKYINTGAPGAGYQRFSFDPDLGTLTGWDPDEPVLQVCDAVFVSSVAGHPWTRTFTVN
jgi:hypothetical protein